MKNNFINYGDSFREQYSKLMQEKNNNNNYNEAMRKEKNKEVDNKINELRTKTYQNINNLKMQEQDKIEQQRKASLSGALITDDIKLLEPKIRLEQSELQDLYNKYRENPVMQRAINNYSREQNIFLTTNANIFDEKIALIETIADYTKSYMESEQWDTVKTEVFNNMDI